MTASEFSRGVLVAAAAALATVGLVACSGTGMGADAVATERAMSEPGPGTGRDAPDAGDAGGAGDASVADADQMAFPGLYLTSDVAVVAAEPTHLGLVASRSCDDLAAMLVAGQWRSVDRLSFGALGAEALAVLAGFGGMAGELLQRGDHLAFVALDGGAACGATVATASRGELTLAGAGLPGNSPGWVAATQCLVSKSTGDLTVNVYFDTDADVGGQGQIALERAGDGYVVNAEDGSAVNLHLLRHGDRFLAAMTEAYATSTEPPLVPLVAGDSFSGSATVESSADGVAPVGQVTLQGLLDETSFEGEITVALPFACPGVVETA